MNPSVVEYEMKLSLNVLNHLGINLYSNLPAVLSEAVANAWDADATRVEVTIDVQSDVVTIWDDGIGMTSQDLNDRYLTVGYERRKDKRNPYGALTPSGRRVMGRKGIGKLSLLSMAKSIEVQSAARRPVDDPDAPLERSGLVLDFDEIQAQIGGSGVDGGTYRPDPLEPEELDIEVGTKLTLTRPRKNINQTATHLRRRLARRFAMSSNEFEIIVNGTPVTAADRDLAKRCRYLWIMGPDSYAKEIKAAVPGAERVVMLPHVTDGGREIRGWLGAAKTSTDLKPEDASDESLNRIAVLVRGKLAQEDVLEGAAQGGVFTKYLSGEIHADFLDDDDDDDIATSSRQGIVEDDPRFMDFRALLSKRIREVGNDWARFRDQDGYKEAVKSVPALEDWLGRFKGDTAKTARRYIGRIQGASLDSRHSKQLLTSGVIAFERLYRSDRLSEIEAADEANLPALIDAFKGIDDVESAMYYDIVKQRLKIIEKFQQLSDDDVLETILQQYLFEHLWLLDPGWDKATVPVMEKQVGKLTEKKGDLNRVDIKYRKTGGSDVIIELKRAGRVVDTTELLEQTGKYRVPIEEYLKNNTDSAVDLQVVCVVGKPLRDWNNEQGRERSRQALGSYNTRVVTYDELVRNAKESYSQYLEVNSELGEIRDLVARIEREYGLSSAESDPA